MFTETFSNISMDQITLFKHNVIRHMKKLKSDWEYLCSTVLLNTIELFIYSDI